jgi:hypothetical protein
MSDIFIVAASRIVNGGPKHFTANCRDLLPPWPTPRMLRSPDFYDRGSGQGHDPGEEKENGGTKEGQGKIFRGEKNA